uniref:Uncharacterized protein n=1 Tax=Arundo donax TaxID=35708 RepID=A0A0A9B891_ARUDO
MQVAPCVAPRWTTRRGRAWGTARSRSADDAAACKPHPLLHHHLAAGSTALGDECSRGRALHHQHTLRR